MDQRKIGSFLKELRKEKNITQEKLAENFGVSSRTISRWETGTNMPDLDMLIQIADYYGIEIREILDGERKGEIMNKEMEETVLKVADYSNNEKQRLTKQMLYLFVMGLVAFIIYLVMLFVGITESGAWEEVASGALGVTLGVMIAGVLFTSGYLAKFRALKTRLLKRK